MSKVKSSKKKEKEKKREHTLSTLNILCHSVTTLSVHRLRTGRGTFGDKNCKSIAFYPVISRCVGQLSTIIYQEIFSVLVFRIYNQVHVAILQKVFQSLFRGRY